MAIPKSQAYGLVRDGIVVARGSKASMEQLRNSGGGRLVRGGGAIGEQVGLITSGQHQRRIAKQTMKMPSEMAGVMGGPTKAESAKLLGATNGQVILEQLGGNRFITMTGARDILAGDKALQFRVPSNITKDRVSHVRITLMPDDEYLLETFRIRGTDVRRVDGFKVQVGELRQTFTKATGLETSLGTMKAQPFRGKPFKGTAFS